MSLPYLSVVIPVYNEQDVLPELFARLYPALDALATSYEVIFINDGSRDRSAGMLVEQQGKRPLETRVILFSGNFGQHSAILAGFAHVRGEVAVTLDADLQNPPEEIHKLLAAYREGSDYVGSVRDMRRGDAWWRGAASKLLNRIRERTTKIKMTDQGCMLRAYSRRIVELVNKTREVRTFIPALAYTFAIHPTEVVVAHAERAAGESKYSFYQLLRLNFDLMTGFSLVPLQIFSLLGMLVAAGSVVTYLGLMVYRGFTLPFWEAMRALLDRDILQFFLIGLVLFGLGIVGEYVGRIYLQVRDRPRYVIDRVVEQSAPAFSPGASDIESSRNLA
jgi:undecaprenyl-phosphate 4-deoxy-4-formamido-L-arabinose transferase